MRVFLVSLLLIFLPLQASWAAVSGYCEHESGLASKHVGHHEHSHDSEAKETLADDAGTVPTSGLADSDCASCHANCTAMVILSNIACVSHKPHASLDAPLVRLYSAFSVPPDRPNWPTLV